MQSFAGELLGSKFCVLSKASSWALRRIWREADLHRGAV